MKTRRAGLRLSGHHVADCISARNVLAVSRGETPKHVVDREVLARPGCQAKLAQWRTA